MKLELKPIIEKLQPLINILKKDSVGIFLAIVAFIFGFLIWRIGVLANAEPSSSAVDEALLTVVKPRIDQKSIESIESLQAQKIDIGSYFSGRDNPFEE